MIDVAVTLILVAIAIAVSWGLRLHLESELAIAVLRAIVQLAAVAAVIRLIFENPPYTALFLIAMTGAAAWTSGRRLKGVPRSTLIAAAAISGATLVALAVLFGLDVFETEPRFLVPIAGMLIGNSMNATSVAGRVLRDEIVDKTLEIETRLALGLRAREALYPCVKRAITTSLVPLIDSTKNVGLILLPGGFVGMILGGASPREAAQVQAVILFMLLGAVAVAAMLAAALVARAFVGSGERIVVPLKSLEARG